MVNISFFVFLVGSISLVASYSVDIRHSHVLSEVVKRPPLSNQSVAIDLREEVLELRKIIRNIFKASFPDPQPESAVTIACGDCYGAGELGECCNTCGSVENAYRNKGWSFNHAEVAQCAGDQRSDVLCGESKSNIQINKCSSFLDCEGCVSHGCGWCISQRACRNDEPWQCQGDIDHIGLGGVGKHTTCPSQEAIKEERAARRDRIKSEEKRSRVSASLEELKVEAEKAEAAVVEAALLQSSMNGDDSAEYQLYLMELETSAKLMRSKVELLTHELMQQNLGSDVEMGRDNRYSELKRRAELHDEGLIKNRPYDILGLDSSATQGEIRSAYRRLSLLLHPDKAVDLGKEAIEWADKAFSDLVSAHEMLGTPDKRAEFDDLGVHSDSTGAFNTEWEFEHFGDRDGGAALFYSGHSLITTLTERLWERRVGEGDAVWIVEFYAPWCSHCQRAVDLFKKAAEEADKKGLGVEFGAVNCVNEGRVCNEWFGIRAYPTFLAVNDFHGTRQEFLGNKDDAGDIVHWAEMVKQEWSWLFRRSSLIHVETPQRMAEMMTDKPKQLFLVMFLDGVDCQPCKTAKTNLMRLAASLHHSNVSVAIVNCEDDALSQWCHGEGRCLGESELECQGVPASPHAPMLRAMSSHRQSEALYNSNELESHLALQMIERVLRHALDLNDHEGTASYDEDHHKEDEKEDEHPDFMWNGPSPKTGVAWGGNTGMHNTRHAIGN